LIGTLTRPAGSASLAADDRRHDLRQQGLRPWPGAPPPGPPEPIVEEDAFMRFPGIRGFGVLVAAVLAVGLVPAAVAVAAPAECDVSDEMVAAGNYWVTNGTNLDAPDWQNATFHVGNLALVRTTGQSNHKTFPWAK